MKNKEYLLSALIQFINKAEKETNDTIVAKALIKHRYHLDEFSLEELAEKYYISQPTITRFVRKLGFKNYNEFKNAMNMSIYAGKNRHPDYHYTSDEEIRTTVKNEIQDALNSIDTIDLVKLHHIIEIIKDYDTIVFMGSELSMSISYKLQLALLSMGKEVYNLYSVNYQEEMLHIIEKRDDVLLICISIEDRWFNYFVDLPNLKELPYKILWTIQDHPSDGKYFDYVYQFGKPMHQDIGYNELMYFILIVDRMLKNK